MKKYIIIKADTNDGDYITSKNLITDEQLDLIKPVAEAIKNFKPYQRKAWNHHHNFPYGECLRDDMGEMSIYEMYGHLEGLKTFVNFIPCDEYGIHTIVSIDVLEIANEIKLV